MISDKSEQEKIIRTIHEQGNLGRDKVTDQAGSRYYWIAYAMMCFSWLVIMCKPIN